MKPTASTTWSRNKIVRVVLVVLAVVAVIALVLFGNQIGKLLEFFGIKAGIEQQAGSITLVESGEGKVPSFTPFNTGNYTQLNTTFDAQGRIILLSSSQPQYCESYEVCDGNVLSDGYCLGQCKLPKSFDWRNVHGENWITPVKNQGSLGSCIYFSTLGAAESVVNLYYNQHINLDLSEQQLFDCKNDPEYINLKDECAACFISDGICSIINIGTVTEECNPYTGSSSDLCNKNPCPSSESFNWKFEDYYNLAFDYNPSGCNHLEKAEEITEEKIKEALIKYGPLESSVFYTEIGIRGHGLVLVGYDTKPDGTYWIFKNSWGPDWGEDGYLKYKVPIREVEGIASAQALIKPVPPTGTAYQINCVDKDKDGLCNWGISKNKPSTCSTSCKPGKDWDDSDPTVGSLGVY